MTINEMTNGTYENMDKVNITMGATPDVAYLESSDPMALMTAVCTAIQNGAKFVAGGMGWARLKA